MIPSLMLNLTTELKIELVLDSYPEIGGSRLLEFGILFGTAASTATVHISRNLSEKYRVSG